MIKQTILQKTNIWYKTLRMFYINEIDKTFYERPKFWTAQAIKQWTKRCKFTVVLVGIE